MGAYSISPMPMSFSAPALSRMMRLSSAEDTAKAMRLGILAFIRPVITSAEGRWVAMTRCIPAARPIWATRHMLSSTSFEATSMRSASSSITTTTLGIFGCPFSIRCWLYASRFLTPSSENSR